MRARRGFTLIELVVAMALLLVFVGIAFGTMSNYVAARSANQQEMLLEQNFRTAMDRMRYDMAQAGSVSSGNGDPIQLPLSNTVSDVLTFQAPSPSTATITYNIAAGTAAGTWRVVRTVSGQPGEPVTEDIHQRVDLYFIRSGGKITVAVVGHMNYFRTDRTVSFVSMIVSRNPNYAG